MPVSRHLTLTCARCGGAAAEISLLPATVKGAGPFSDRDRLERTDFMGSVTKFGEYADLLAFFERLARQDFAAARGRDADFVAFHCWECGKVYCERCWTLGAPVFDEGFYDYTLGTCPEGHEQVVDD
jgi:hypothetical protein